MSRTMMVAIFGAWLGLLMVVDSYCKDKKEGVREQLADLQKETGLTLAKVLWGVSTVDFAHRFFSGKELPPPVGEAQDGIVSPDGTEIAFEFHRSASGLGIARSDGTVIGEYKAFVHPRGFCWASDKSRLVVSAEFANESSVRPRSGLFVLDLTSGVTREIDSQGAVLSQCWSHDGRQIVYHSGSSIRIYDTVRGHSRALAQGICPTWSPDGEWIAFLNGAVHDTYYAIRASSDERKLLFKVRNASSGLLWSPDSRIVAYQTLTRNLNLFDPTLLYRVHVRRLTDSADDWVAVVTAGEEVAWVQPESGRH